MTERLPDFVVIGAAKSGTTTLQAWLMQQPDVFMCRKEPRFFADRWNAGRGWYAGLFADAPQGALCGEISPKYTTYEYADVAASRMAQLIPDARLVYVVRQPIDRLISHYRFRSVQARASRSFDEIIAAPNNFLVEGSKYFSRLSPFIDAFPRERICVVRFEDLVAAEGSGWRRILEHLALPDRPAPASSRNRTDALRPVSPLVRRMSDARRRLHLPSPPRALVRLTRSSARTAENTDPFDGKNASVPTAVAAAIWDDVARLESWLGGDTPLWPREQ